MAMSEHRLFYFPYAAFANTQLPFLKVAALYFDKLVILDPIRASWNSVSVDQSVQLALRLLKDEGFLETVVPSDVLSRYSTPIAEAIRRDMSDPEFLKICAAHRRASGKERWTLSLAKVPEDLQAEEIMRYVMGPLSREALVLEQSARAPESEPIIYDETEVGAMLEQAARFRRSIPDIPVYDEYREGYEGNVEYRYADFPLALGEAIMINHALFAGLLYAGATPITDDLFHNQVLSSKLKRAEQDPAVQQAMADRARVRGLKRDVFTTTALTDRELKLPALSSDVPLEEVLEYRQKHKDALGQARDKLSGMARRIEAEPWSEEFAREIEHETIPDLAKELDEVRKARDAWLGSKRQRLALKAGSIAFSAAAAVLTLVVAPLTPVTLATAGLSLASGMAIPGAEWMLDWRDGKQAMQENGLHYFLAT
jgi:hypothetical protein